jgi:hypothetical protein
VLDVGGVDLRPHHLTRVVDVHHLRRRCAWKVDRRERTAIEGEAARRPRQVSMDADDHTVTVDAGRDARLRARQREDVVTAARDRTTIPAVELLRGTTLRSSRPRRSPAG